MIFTTFLYDKQGELHRYIVDERAKTKRKVDRYDYRWLGLPYRSCVSLLTWDGNPLWALGLEEIK